MENDQDWDVPMSGAIPVGAGLPSVIRIPIPGTKGLCIELKSRGWKPKTGSTSALFFHDKTGKRHLRLDYGHNVKTGQFEYHWNQKGTHSNFGIANHTPAGNTGKALYYTAKYFRHAGRAVLVAGMAMDVVSIVVADKPLRRTAEVVAGWAGAWAACKVVGAGLGAAGTAVAPGPGTAVGGIGGCIIGGVGGYYGGAALAGSVYDWAEDTIFTPLPQTAGP